MTSKAARQIASKNSQSTSCLANSISSNSSSSSSSNSNSSNNMLHALLWKTCNADGVRPAHSCIPELPISSLRYTYIFMVWGLG